MVIMDSLKLKLFQLMMYIKDNVHDNIKEQHYVEILGQIAIIYKGIDAEKIVNENESDEESTSYNDDYIEDYI